MLFVSGVISKYRSLLRQINSTYSTIDIIQNHDNWENTQNDVFEFFEFLNVIFDIKNTTKIIDGDNSPFYTNFSTILPIDAIIDETIPVKISDYFPITNFKYKLSSNNKINGKSYYYKKMEILKAQKLFIKIYRNIGNFKIRTKIIPPKSLKLKENSFNLYLTSIIIHYGSFNAGHYICLYNCNNVWYEYNDMSRKIIKIGLLNNIYDNDSYLSNIVGLIYSMI